MEEVFLFWQTAAELNNSGFEIQKSNDGRNWQIIDFVDGQGTSNEVNEYQYQDINPLPGANYYRLRQVDYDGQFSYSPVRRVQHGPPEKPFTFYPNPVHHELQLSTTGTWEGGTLRLLNGAGELVRSIQLAPHLQSTSVDLSMLPAGTYTLEIVGGEAVWRERLVKQ